MVTEIYLGKFKIHLPDGDDKSFMIYHDIAELFGEDDQRSAVKKLSSKLKERSVLPFPKIYFEYITGIRTSKPQVIFDVIKIIDELSLKGSKVGFTVKEWEQLNNILLLWKAPKKQIWKIGDIFSIKLRDGDFAFGQVLSKTPTVALLDFKQQSEDISKSDLNKKNILSIIHTTPGLLNNHSWRVMINNDLLVDKDSGPDGPYLIRIGLVSYSPNVLNTICDYYWFGFCKWTNEEDLKKLIINHKN